MEKLLLSSVLLGLILLVAQPAHAVLVTRSCRAEITQAIRQSNAPRWMRSYIRDLTMTTLRDNWSREEVRADVLSRLTAVTGNEVWARSLTLSYMEAWDSIKEEEVCQPRLPR